MFHFVGGRGTNKTSCFDFALAPIRAKDNEEYENYVEAKAAYDLECSKPAKERKKIPEPPVFHQYILSDFTPEVLVHQHRANPRGLIVFNDELMGFILGFNKYRSGISEESMRCSIALCYYFLACGLKAQKRFVNSPTEEFTQTQREVYDELPQNFETKQGVEIAESLGMPSRTFKRWLNTSLFKKISYGFYEKKYR